VSNELVERISYLETELCEQGRKHSEALSKLKQQFAESEEAKKPGQWVLVGRENEELTVPPNSLLRYGLNACWVEKRHSGNFKATNQFFGKDPLYGTGKIVEMWVQ
jgi:hypothetical protein